MEAGPGLSLFQGSESIQLNTIAQGLEEDEEQEDKRRLNEEVTSPVSAEKMHARKSFARVEYLAA